MSIHLYHCLLPYMYTYRIGFILFLVGFHLLWIICDTGDE